MTPPNPPSKRKLPSTWIYKHIGKTSSDPEWQEKAIDAIIDYLDAVYTNEADFILEDV